MEDEFTLDELVLVFSYHVVNQILSSDGTLTSDELRFLARTFPKDPLRQHGFVDEEGGHTLRWSEALGEALLRLPEMPSEERLRIVHTSLAAARADGRVEAAETEIVRRAARLLGLPAEEIEAAVPRETP